MKKTLKWVGLGTAVLILVLAAASLFLYLTIDRTWVEDRLEASLSRKVTIGGIRFAPFAAVAGLGVEEVVVSDRMGESRIKELSSVPEDGVFVRLESGKLKINLLPLLARRLDVRGIQVEKPEIRVVRFPDKTFNFSDLLPPDDAAREKTAKARQALSIGRLTIRGGRALLTDQLTGSVYRITDFDLTGDKDRTSPSGLGVQADFHLDAQRLPGASFARSLNIDFQVEGGFETLLHRGETSLPPFQFAVRTPRGRLEGFRIFERLKQVPLLQAYFGRLDFLGNDLEWQKGSLRISHRGGTVEFSEGDIRVGEYRLTYEGSYKTAGALEVKAVLIMPAEMAQTLKDLLRRNLDEHLSERLKKRIDVPEVAGKLVQPLVAENGEIRLTYRIHGTPTQPQVSLVDPALPGFGEALIRLAGEDARASVQSLVESMAGKLLKKRSEKDKQERYPEP